MGYLTGYKKMFMTVSTTIEMNKTIFYTSDMSQAYGRKIDMVLKCSFNVKVDIFSNK